MQHQDRKTSNILVRRLAFVLAFAAMAAKVQGTQPPETLYVIDHFPGNSVFQYVIGSEGRLIPIVPAHVECGAGTTCQELDWTRHLLYVGSENPEFVYEFAVLPGGALAGHPRSSTPTVASVSRLVISPRRNALYVLTREDLRQYRIAPDGDLTRFSPWKLPVGRDPAAMALHPSGKLLYVLSLNTGDFMGQSPCVYYYHLSADGSLRPFEKGIGVYVRVHGSCNLAAHPAGRYVYLPDRNGLVSFAVEKDGSLRQVLYYEDGGRDSFDDTAWVFIHPSGKFIYLLRPDQHRITWFRYDEKFGCLYAGDAFIQESGAISDKSLPDKTAGVEVRTLVFANGGEVAYVVDSVGQKVLGYHIGEDGRPVFVGVMAQGFGPSNRHDPAGLLVGGGGPSKGDTTGKHATDRH